MLTVITIYCHVNHKCTHSIEYPYRCSYIHHPFTCNTYSRNTLSFIQECKLFTRTHQCLTIDAFPLLTLEYRWALGISNETFSILVRQNYNKTLNVMHIKKVIGANQCNINNASKYVTALYRMVHLSKAT